MGSSGIDHGERRGTGRQRRPGFDAAPDAVRQGGHRAPWDMESVAAFGVPLVIEVELEHHVNVTVPHSSGAAVQTHRRRVGLVR